MGKQEKRVLTLDRYEHGVVVNALNEMRNDLLEKERPTDIAVSYTHLTLPTTDVV